MSGWRCDGIIATVKRPQFEQPNQGRQSGLTVRKHSARTVILVQRQRGRCQEEEVKVREAARR